MQGGKGGWRKRLIRRRKVLEGTEGGRRSRRGGYVNRVIDPSGEIVERKKERLLRGTKVICERGLFDIRLDVCVIVPREWERVTVV